MLNKNDRNSNLTQKSQIFILEGAILQYYKFGKGHRTVRFCRTLKSEVRLNFNNMLSRTVYENWYLKHPE